MSFSQQQIQAGAAVYTPRTLAFYDLAVLRISNRLIWRCPTARLMDHYNDHVSGNHLDVGVGSGFFPDRCRFPTSAPRLALMDSNADSLAYASSRVGRYRPEVYLRNVLEPVSMTCDRFDSIAVNYLLHCLPGVLRTKAVVMDLLGEVLNPGGSLFGSTLLGKGVRRNWAARRLMDVYNKKQIFSNSDDELGQLREALASRFQDVEIVVVGCAALFSAVKPDPAP